MAKPDDADPVAKARAAFAALEPKAPGTGKASKFDAVMELYPDIVNARVTLHYTDSELVAMLKANKIEITLGTFRQYMQRIARLKKGDAPAKPSVKPVERKANANANKGANVTTNATANAPQVAPNSPAKPGATKPKLGFENKFDDE